MLFLYQVDVLAQDMKSKADSLIKLADSEIVVTQKISLLIEAYELSHNNLLFDAEESSLKNLIDAYKQIGLDEHTYSYSLKLEYLYEINNKYEKLAKVKYSMGLQLLEMELPINAKSYFLETERLFHLINNISLKQKSLKYLGGIASNEGENEEAIIWYNKSLQQAKKEFKENEINSLYQLIGIEYQKSKKYDKGISYYNELLGQLRFNGSKNVRGILHNNLGILYSKKGDNKAAEEHFKRAIKLIDQEKEYADILAKANINLAIISQKAKMQHDAINYTRKASFLSSLSDNIQLKNEISYITSNMYYYTSDYYNALLYINEAIDGSRKSQNRKLTSSALLFKSKIYGALNNYELERDFKTSYLQEENHINNENVIHENELNSKRISIERIEKEALVFQKKSAENIAENERRNAENQAQKARESQILRDRAIVLAQHEVDKNKIIEIEKDAAINKSKRDSLAASNALAKEEIAIEKSRSDSITTMLAVQRQKEAQKEVDAANEILQRSYLIGILFIIIIIIVIGGIIYQRRLNNQISKERDKSDKLLLNILPQRIANELKYSSKVPPRKYEKVSVLFTDFVGFTNIAEILSEDELIEELDRYFNAFDEIIEKFNLEKIKTIGDSYMCAGGVPSPNTTNAFDAVKAGLEIADFVYKDVEEKKELGIPYWNIRIGINTGSVIAGVVGSKKFAYDIWGDTVNTASRIESNGLAGFVNISESTYNEVKTEFNCVSRGMIIAKNKGAVPMYYIKTDK